MPGIFPNPSAAAENFTVGDQVKWFVNEQAISPYVGVVTQICPSINKLWVEFPVGGNQQKDPTELILITKFVGESPVVEDTGYSSYDKEKSDKEYGRISPKTKDQGKKLLRNLIKEKDKGEEKKGKKKEASESLLKSASGIAQNFATGVVEKLASDVINCKGKGLSDIQAYQQLYPQYESICSDGFLRGSISKLYKEAVTESVTQPAKE